LYRILTIALAAVLAGLMLATATLLAALPRFLRLLARLRLTAPALLSALTRLLRLLAWFLLAGVLVRILV